MDVENARKVLADAIKEEKEKKAAKRVLLAREKDTLRMIQKTIYAHNKTRNVDIFSVIESIIKKQYREIENGSQVESIIKQYREIENGD